MATRQVIKEIVVEDIDERSFKAGAIGVSQGFVDFLREKNNERARRERARLENERSQSSKRR